MNKDLTIAIVAAAVVVLVSTHFVAYMFGRVHEVQSQRKALKERD